MQLSKYQKSVFAVCAALLIIMIAIAASLPVHASPVLPSHPAQNQFAVPTPITTPSNLDALNTTSDISAGGNMTVAGTLNVTGAITGTVLQYPASGKRIVCGSSTITGTGTISHGLATPSYVQVSLNSDVAGDHARLSSTNSSATVTAKVWTAALTPVAATTPVTVDWCVIGTP